MHGARDRLLEATKRPALRLLHRTRAGEALLVRLYLEAERHAERAAPWEPLLASAPRWLGAWLDRHRADERRHAELFAHRLRDLLGTPQRVADATSGHRSFAAMYPSVPEPSRDGARRAELAGSPRDTNDADDTHGGFDVISRRKLAALHRLVVRHTPAFGAGALVPALAIAWRMEEMGVRVFARHAEVLADVRPDAPLLPILQTVLDDERRHARAARRCVERLTSAHERAALALLVKRIDRIERRMGVTGAAVLWTWGGLLWMRAALASFISR